MGCLQTHLPATEQVILTQGMKSKWGVEGMRWPTTEQWQICGDRYDENGQKIGIGAQGVLKPKGGFTYRI